MIITKALNLYLGAPAAVQRPVFVSQNDTGWAFACTIYQGADVWTIPSGTTATINGSKPDGTAFSYDCTISGNVVTAPCEEQMTVIPGNVDCEIKFTQGGRVIATANFRLIVEASPTGEYRPSETELAALDNALDEVQTIAAQVRAAYGAPLTASSASGMTDTNRIYVYTGTTSGGYTKGNWYYYNGSSWVSGGVYNSTAFETDKTLAVSGAAADSKTVGNVKNYIDNNLAGINEAVFTRDVRSSSATGFYPLTANSGLSNPATGGNTTSNKYCRTGFIIINPRLLTLGLPEYEWCAWAYSGTTWATKTHTLNGGIYYNGANPIYVQPKDGDKYYLVSFRRVDGAVLTTSTTDETSDFYKIQHAFHIWAAEHIEVDDTLTVSGAAADAKAAGDALDKVKHTVAIFSLDNIGGDVFEEGKAVNASTGELFDNSSMAASGFVDVSAAGRIIYTRLIVTGSQPISGMAFYDASGTYISGNASGFGEENGVDYVTIDVPETAATARFTYYKPDAAAYYGRPFEVYNAETYGAALIARAAYQEELPIIPGTMLIDSGADGFSYGYFYPYRKTGRFLEVGDAPVVIRLEPKDAAKVASFSIYQYRKTETGAEFISRVHNLTLAKDGTFVYLRGDFDSADYICIGFTLTESTEEAFCSLRAFSAEPIKAIKRPYIPNPSYGNITISYEVSPGVYTSGQLMLPPNYKADGSPVPLWVNVHGTGAMATWTDRMGVNGDTDSRYLYEYMANEGFAVFDCFPWTSKYYKTSNQISPFAIAIHERAYIQGIRFVCDAYNVDINRVCMSFKSLGGNLGYWFMNQAEFAPKALAMLAPSTGFASTIWATYFLQENARRNMVNVLGLTGKEGADLFISTTRGMKNATVVKFVEDNLDAFAGIICAGIGVHGATFRDQYDWMVTGEKTEPAWMVEKGIPMWPADWQSGNGTGVPALVNHPDLSKHSLYPVKYWQAFDDVNTSAHANYTIYNWLKNGGSDVQWRTMPEGTGGHHAIDTGENALKSSGTTRLGIAYANIATTYVEMADFFFDKMC